MMLFKQLALACSLLLVELAVSNSFLASIKVTINSPTDQVPISENQKYDTEFVNATNVPWQPSPGEWDLSGNSPEDIAMFHAAHLDMMAVLDAVSRHPLTGPSFDRYFPGGQYATRRAKAVYDSVLVLADRRQPTFPPVGISPTKLNGIRVTRATGGDYFILAEAENVERDAVGHLIKVYPFGWHALYERLRPEIKCDDIGPVTNYKMHMLGTLLLHETLHFHSVSDLAWSQGVGHIGPDDVVDDQPGDFPILKRAYGPFEAVQLARSKPADALKNIENYVWFALETYWAEQCPTKVPAAGVFTAPTSNDLVNVVCQAVKGVVVGCAQW